MTRTVVKVRNDSEHIGVDPVLNSGDNHHHL